MNDQQMDALMQLVPEKYLEETMQYCMEHARDTVPGITKKSVPRRMLWLAAPVSAAACLAAVFGLGFLLRANTTAPPAESLANDITEVQPTAETTTDTTVSSQSSTTAKRESETRRGSVTQTAAELLTTDSGSSAASQNTTAQNTNTAAKTTGSAHTTAQTETKPLPTIAGRPYDPEIVAKYQLGDVDMDGNITTADAAMLNAECIAVLVDGEESTLSAEQLVLGDIIKDNRAPLPVVSRLDNLDLLAPASDYPISWADAYVLLVYTTESEVVQKDASQLPFAVFAKSGSYREEGRRLLPDETTVWRYTEPSEESVALPALGCLPAHVGEWDMIGYVSYSAVTCVFYGSGERYLELDYTQPAGDSELPENGISVTAKVYSDGEWNNWYDWAENSTEDYESIAFGIGDESIKQFVGLLNQE